MNAAERETTIVMSDADDSVRIWTAQRPVITALRKKTPTVTELASGNIDGSPWAEFSVPADMFHPARGVRHKLNLTDEQRAARTARLKPAHAA